MSVSLGSECVWPFLTAARTSSAVAGATAELVRVAVRNGQTHALPKLTDTLLALHLAVLAHRRWPASPTAGT